MDRLMSNIKPSKSILSCLIQLAERYRRREAYHRMAGRPCCLRQNGPQNHWPAQMLESVGLRVAGCALFFGMRWATAHADVDLSGSWGQKIHEDFEERVVGPSIGDFTGLPINAAARRRAESWDDGYWSVPEHQCEAAPADYATHGPGSLRMWSEV